MQVFRRVGDLLMRGEFAFDSSVRYSNEASQIRIEEIAQIVTQKVQG
jgi:hypothetical protein